MTYFLLPETEKKGYRRLTKRFSLTGAVLLVAGIISFFYPSSLQTTVGHVEAIAGALVGGGVTLIVADITAVELRRHHDELKARLELVQEANRTKFRAASVLASIMTRLANQPNDPNLLRIGAREADILDGKLDVRKSFDLWISGLQHGNVTKQPVQMNEGLVRQSILDCDGALPYESYFAILVLAGLAGAQQGTDPAVIATQRQILSRCLKDIGAKDFVVRYVEGALSDFTVPATPGEVAFLSLINAYIEQLGIGIGPALNSLEKFLNAASSKKLLTRRLEMPINSREFQDKAQEVLTQILALPHLVP